MKAEVISIGTELLLGEITDLNAAYLASQLPLLGVDLYYMSTVGDNKQRLIETLRHAFLRSDIIITTGGLGPTEDDITREAIADLCNETISIDQSLVNQFRETFKKFSMEMPESNLKQAFVISSCQIIPNPRGTAPGWWVEHDGHVIISMPGPPNEMQLMWTNVIVPRIRAKYCDAVIYSSTIKTFGLSEAKLGEITRSYLLANNPTVGIYAKPDGIHLRVTAKAPSQEEARRLVNKRVDELKVLCDDYIWGMDNDTLEGIIANLFSDKNMSLATIEINTGGVLANILTNYSESWQFYRCGIVTNQNELKSDFNINGDTINQHNNICQQVAREAAAAVRARYKASVGIGLMAAIEPNDSDLKPGTVILSIDNSRHNYIFSSAIAGNRKQIKQGAAMTALFELRKIMLQEIKCT